MRALALVAVATFFGALILLFHEAVWTHHTAMEWAGLALGASLTAGFLAILVTLAFAAGHTVAALALPAKTSPPIVVACGAILTLGFFALLFTGTITIPGAER